MNFRNLFAAASVTPVVASAPATAASAESTNLAIARRFVTEGLGKADMKVFDDLVDTNVVVTTGLSPKAPIQGSAACKQVFAGFADAWPVSKLVIEEIFAAGDKVVVKFTATTVFTKDYYGVKATNQVVPLTEMHVFTQEGQNRRQRGRRGQSALRIHHVPGTQGRRAGRSSAREVTMARSMPRTPRASCSYAFPHPRVGRAQGAARSTTMAFLSRPSNMARHARARADMQAAPGSAAPRHPGSDNPHAGRARLRRQSSSVHRRR